MWESAPALSTCGRLSTEAPSKLPLVRFGETKNLLNREGSRVPPRSSHVACAPGCGGGDGPPLLGGPVYMYCRPGWRKARWRKACSRREHVESGTQGVKRVGNCYCYNTCGWLLSRTMNQKKRKPSGHSHSWEVKRRWEAGMQPLHSSADTPQQPGPGAPELCRLGAQCGAPRGPRPR